MKLYLTVWLIFLTFDFFITSITIIRSISEICKSYTRVSYSDWVKEIYRMYAKFLIFCTKSLKESVAIFVNLYN